MENIKDVKVCNEILDDPHAVMYMPINPKKNIDEFKKHGNNKVMQIFQ
jgi:hypothetical protein